MLEKNVILGVDKGHCIAGPDYGASGIREESELTREVGNLAIEKLKARGHSVIDCTVDHAADLSASLWTRAHNSNSGNVGMFISIHFNVTKGGHGTEIYTYGARQIPEAIDILHNMEALGFTNRGIKDGSGLYVIRNTVAPAMLVECCFCDSEEDMQLYNADSIANAIVNGLAGTLEVETPAPVVTPPTIKPPVVEPPTPVVEKKTWEHYITGDLVERLQTEINLQFGKPIKIDGYFGDESIASLEGIVIKKEAEGNITRIIQERLIALGYNLGKSGADGDFGGMTEKAVIAFQKDHDLDVDGEVGINTFKALFLK